jgi:hypothetical protein
MTTMTTSTGEARIAEPVTGLMAVGDDTMFHIFTFLDGVSAETLATSVHGDEYRPASLCKRIVTISRSDRFWNTLEESIPANGRSVDMSVKQRVIRYHRALGFSEKAFNEILNHFEFFRDKMRWKGCHGCSKLPKLSVMNHTYEGEGLFGATESATGLAALSNEPDGADSEDLNENSIDDGINLETVAVVVVVDDDDDDEAEEEEEEAENYLNEDGLSSDISSEAEGVTDLSIDSIECDEFFLSIFWKFKSSTNHRSENIIWSGFVQGNRRDMIRYGYGLHEEEERKPVIDTTLFLEAVNDDIFASFDRFIESRADEDPLHIAGGISLREKYEQLLRGAVFVVVGMNTRDGPSLFSFFASHIRSSMRDFFKSRSLSPPCAKKVAISTSVMARLLFLKTRVPIL